MKDVLCLKIEQIQVLKERLGGLVLGLFADSLRQGLNIFLDMPISHQNHKHP